MQKNPQKISFNELFSIQQQKAKNSKSKSKFKELYPNHSEEKISLFKKFYTDIKTKYSKTNDDIVFQKELLNDNQSASYSYKQKIKLSWILTAVLSTILMANLYIYPTGTLSEQWHERNLMMQKNSIFFEKNNAFKKHTEQIVNGLIDDEHLNQELLLNQDNLIKLKELHQSRKKDYEAFTTHAERMHISILSLFFLLLLSTFNAIFTFRFFRLKYERFSLNKKLVDLENQKATEVNEMKDVFANYKTRFASFNISEATSFSSFLNDNYTSKHTYLNNLNKIEDRFEIQGNFIFDPAIITSQIYDDFNKIIDEMEVISEEILTIKNLK